MFIIRRVCFCRPYICYNTKALRPPLTLFYPFLDLQAYFILDDILIAGELQESNKKSVLRLVTTQVAYLLNSEAI